MAILASWLDAIRARSEHPLRYLIRMLVGALLFFPGVAIHIVAPWFHLPPQTEYWVSTVGIAAAVIGGLIALSGYLMILLIWLVRFLDT